MTEGPKTELKTNPFAGDPLPEIVDVRDGKTDPHGLFLGVLIDGEKSEEFWCFVDVPGRRGAKYITHTFPGPSQINTKRSVKEVDDIDIALYWLTTEELSA